MRSTELEPVIAATEAGDYAAALNLLAPLAEAGLPSAVGMLGVFYQLGLGVEPNGPKAVALLTQAAEAGDAIAAHNLGTVYCTGLPGLPSDPALGHTWYQRARAMGAQLAPDQFYE